jgi:hypothetical protein
VKDDGQSTLSYRPSSIVELLAYLRRRVLGSFDISVQARGATHFAKCIAPERIRQISKEPNERQGASDARFRHRQSSRDDNGTRRFLTLLNGC